MISSMFRKGRLVKKESMEILRNLSIFNTKKNTTLLFKHTNEIMSIHLNSLYPIIGQQLLETVHLLQNSSSNDTNIIIPSPANNTAVQTYTTAHNVVTLVID